VTARTDRRRQQSEFGQRQREAMLRGIATAAENEARARQLARQGVDDYEIAFALRLAVADVRRLIGGHTP
jgi:hypothetical protein